MMFSRKHAFLILFITVLPVLLYGLAIVSGDDVVGAFLLGLSGLLIIGLVVFYLIHLYRTPQFDLADRVLWLMLILIGNLLAMPVYWYLYIRPKRRDGAA